jgi:hypothetical protein
MGQLSPTENLPFQGARKSLPIYRFTHSTFSASPQGFCFRNCLAAFHLSYRGRKTLADRFRGAISFSRKLHFVVSAASYSSLNVTPSDALSHAPTGVTSRKTETSDCLAPRNNQKTQDHLGISEHLPAEVLPYSSRTWNLETGLDLLKIVSTQSHPPEVLGPAGVSKLSLRHQRRGMETLAESLIRSTGFLQNLQLFLPQPLFKRAAV